MVFPLVVVGSVLVLVTVQAKKARANLTVLGDKLGLNMATAGRFFKKYRLVGEVRGKAVEVFSYTTGSGKSQQRWVAIVVAVRAAGGLTFTLKRRFTLFEFIARQFRKNAVEIGDAAFDQQWVLTTNHATFMRSALLPEMREKILRFGGRGWSSGNFKYETYKVQYAEQGSFSDAKLCARFEEMVSLLCDLSDAIEVYADLQK